MTHKAFLIIIIFFLSTPLWAQRELTVDELREAFLNARSREGTRLGDYTFFDENGVEFSLDSFRDNKPLVIGYVFTSCPDVCPRIITEIEKALKDSRIELTEKDPRGHGFNVLIFGFDAKQDIPERLKKYREISPSFKFASASASSIRGFTESTGFFYSLRPDRGFDHIDMVTLVDAQGFIYRQIFGIGGIGGIKSNRADFADALRELEAPMPSAGRQRPTLLDRLKYFCYTYDPYTGNPSLDYARLLGLMLEFSVISALVAILWGKNIKGFFRRFYR